MERDKELISDPFEEYLREGDPSKRERSYAWHTAIGLQAVDGLKTSDYLVETAIKNIDGEITLTEAKTLIEAYYQNDRKKDSERTEEADKVSARITAILSEKGFSFSAAQYLSIHRQLFGGIYKHAGEMRTYNVTKQEWVLDGDTVTYGYWSSLKETLDYDVSQEKAFDYTGLSMDEIIRHLARFVSRLWQIHVFEEGNTRATAVFFIKYLQSLGFNVTNDIFAKNAWYFRNALVRANYNNLQKGVHETTRFLELFLRNLLLGEHNPLRNRTMHVSNSLAKQDIGEEKQDIVMREHAFDRLVSQGITVHTTNNTLLLLNKFGFKLAFRRSDVVSLLNLTPSPASELIKKLLECGAIVQVTGHGKGCYRFDKAFFTR